MATATTTPITTAVSTLPEPGVSEEEVEMEGEVVELEKEIHHM